MPVHGHLRPGSVIVPPPPSCPRWPFGGLGPRCIARGFVAAQQSCRNWTRGEKGACRWQRSRTAITSCAARPTPEDTRLVAALAPDPGIRLPSMQTVAPGHRVRLVARQGKCRAAPAPVRSIRADTAVAVLLARPGCRRRQVGCAGPALRRQACNRTERKASQHGQPGTYSGTGCSVSKRRSRSSFAQVDRAAHARPQLYHRVS